MLEFTNLNKKNENTNSMSASTSNLYAGLQQSPPVDLTAIFSTVNNDMEILKKLVDHLLTNYPFQLRKMRQMIEAGDTMQVRLLAHTFKGSVSNFGAREAVSIAYAIEQMGMKSELDNALAALSRLEEEMNKIYVYFSDTRWEEGLQLTAK